MCVGWFGAMVRCLYFLIFAVDEAMETVDCSWCRVGFRMVVREVCLPQFALPTLQADGCATAVPRGG